VPWGEVPACLRVGSAPPVCFVSRLAAAAV
jgi:hypothetical protein